MALRTRLRFAAFASLPLFLCSACRKEGNTGAFTGAINDYYSAHPDCLWPDSVSFPVQLDFGDHEGTMRMETLVGRGLLAHAWGSRKDPTLGTVPTLTYTVKDRSMFTPDPGDASKGNFCYGHRTVESIDKVEGGIRMLKQTARVHYRFTLAGTPAWATDPGTVKVFPELRSPVRGAGEDIATLVHSRATPTNSGWRVVFPLTTPVAVH